MSGELGERLSVKKNIVANYFGQTCKGLMGIILVPFYIRYLGIEAYGLIGIFAILQSGLTLLDMGMKPALGREMARFTAGAHDSQSIRDLLRSVEVIAAGTSLAIFLCVWASSGWLALHWVKPATLSTQVVQHAFVAMGLLAALRFVENVYVSSIVGLQRQVLESIVGSSTAIVRGLGAVGVLAWISPTVEAFFLWQCAISMTSLPLLAVLVYRSMPPSGRAARFSLDAVTGIWRFAAGITAITMLALLLTQVDKILLSRLLPLTVFAYYSLAGVLTTSLYMLTSPISAAFYPQFTELATRDRAAALIHAYHQAAQLTTVALGSAAVIMIVFPDLLIRLWTGNPSLAQHAAPLLRVLALGTLLNGLMGVPYQLQLAHGWTALTVRINVAAVALVVPAIFIVAPVYGAIGAAWIWVTVNTGYLVVSIYFMHRRLIKTEKWRWYGQDVLLPMMGAAVTALFCRWAMPHALRSILELGFLVLSAACVLFVTAVMCPLVRPQLAKHARGVRNHVCRY